MPSTPPRRQPRSPRSKIKALSRSKVQPPRHYFVLPNAKALLCHAPMGAHWPRENPARRVSDRSSLLAAAGSISSLPRRCVDGDGRGGNAPRLAATPRGRQDDPRAGDCNGISWMSGSRSDSCLVSTGKKNQTLFCWAEPLFWEGLTTPLNNHIPLRGCPEPAALENPPADC